MRFLLRKIFICRIDLDRPSTLVLRVLYITRQSIEVLLIDDRSVVRVFLDGWEHRGYRLRSRFDEFIKLCLGNENIVGSQANLTSVEGLNGHDACGGVLDCGAF